MQKSSSRLISDIIHFDQNEASVFATSEHQLFVCPAKLANPIG
ncbi:hypothetical protein [Pseudoalteromonas sp.]